VRKESLNRFMDLLLSENEKTNLVSRRLTQTDLEQHVEDALAACPYQEFSGREVIDVGSGGGFPGVPLAIAFPAGRFTFVEADLKKSQFLMRVCQELNLVNTRVVRERAEVLGRDPRYREKFDVATARAVAELNVLLEYVLPLVKVGGEFIAWKGKNYPVELERAGPAMETLGGDLQEVKKYILGDGYRYLLFIKKVAATPERFPRRTGVPAKRPL